MASANIMGHKLFQDSFRLQKVLLPSALENLLDWPVITRVGHDVHQRVQHGALLDQGLIDVDNIRNTTGRDCTTRILDSMAILDLFRGGCNRTEGST